MNRRTVSVNILLDQRCNKPARVRKPGWITSHNGERHNLYASPNIIIVIKGHGDG